MRECLGCPCVPVRLVRWSIILQLFGCTLIPTLPRKTRRKGTRLSRSLLMKGIFLFSQWDLRHLSIFTWTLPSLRHFPSLTWPWNKSSKHKTFLLLKIIDEWQKNREESEKSRQWLEITSSRIFFFLKESSIRRKGSGFEGFARASAKGEGLHLYALALFTRGERVIEENRWSRMQGNVACWITLYRISKFSRTPNIIRRLFTSYQMLRLWKRMRTASLSACLSVNLCNQYCFNNQSKAKRQRLEQLQM